MKYKEPTVIGTRADELSLSDYFSRLFSPFRFPGITEEDKMDEKGNSEQR